jgi:hypothetical protein
MLQLGLELGRLGCEKPPGVMALLGMYALPIRGQTLSLGSDRQSTPTAPPYLSRDLMSPSSTEKKEKEGQLQK